MSIDTVEKRRPGRPAGRTYVHQARVPMTPQMWLELSMYAEQDGRSVASLMRELAGR